MSRRAVRRPPGKLAARIGRLQRQLLGNAIELPTRYGVLHWGARRSFTRAARHVSLAGVDLGWVRDPVDVVLVEPPGPLGGDEVELARLVRDWVDVPIVVVARSAEVLGSGWASVADAVVSDDERLVGGGVVGVEPFVDESKWNPVGWSGEASRALFAPFGVKSFWRGVSRGSRLRGPAVDAAFDADLRSDPAGDDLSEFSVRLFERWVKSSEATVVRPPVGEPRGRVMRVVLRAAACGGPVVVMGSEWDSEVLAEAGIPVVADHGELRDVWRLWADPVEREKVSVRQRRHVLYHHSSLNRFEEILELVGVRPKPPEVVSVLMSTKRREFLDHAVKSVAEQRYPAKELVLVLHGDEFDSVDQDRIVSSVGFPVQVLRAPESWMLGECLNAGLDRVSGDLVTKMDDDDYYDANHLFDLVSAYRYSGATVVGKRTNFTYLSGQDLTVVFAPGWEEAFTTHLPGATMLMSTALLRELRFGAVPRHIDTELLDRIKQRGGSLYSTHRFNFTRVRHDDHTFAQTDQYFIDHSSRYRHQGHPTYQTTT